jgi:uncharacterized protein DUF3574
MRFVIGICVSILLSGCASLPQSCMPPAQTMATAEMFFGRKIGDRVGVSEAAFAQFTAREITPRFPDGLSVIDARGQWRDTERGTVVREPSKLVLITFHDDAQKRADLGAIADAYKQQFSQQSVMTSIRTACVGF